MSSEGGNPQLDILSGNINNQQEQARPLMYSTTIKNLSTGAASPGGGGNEYYFLWTYKATTYFANAEVDSTGAVTYHDGTVSGNQCTNANTDTGKFTTGENGTSRSTFRSPTWVPAEGDAADRTGCADQGARRHDAERWADRGSRQRRSEVRLHRRRSMHELLMVSRRAGALAGTPRLRRKRLAYAGVGRRRAARNTGC